MAITSVLLKVMLPMVAVSAELDRAAVMLDAEFEALRAEGITCARPPLGIMVEVPAAAITPELFDADFFSIGTNDLAQYVTAAGRDIAALADLNQASNPAVLRLIQNVAAHGAQVCKDVSLCGDAAADPARSSSQPADSSRGIASRFRL